MKIKNMNINIKKLYNEKVYSRFEDFIKVSLDPSYVQKIDEFTDKIIQAKLLEEDHKIDNGKEKKRWMTGMLGEAAVEKLLNIKIIDWTIGNSQNYNIPDIDGYKVGIKTMDEGNFPIIYKRNNYPQIFCIRSKNNPLDIYICGLATTDILNKYQSDDLILSPSLRAKGYKTGFYGLDKLIPIKSLNDISKYKV